MKIRVPDYFLKFKCIADQCQDSCCIGWEIDIDGKALDKYASLSGDLGCEIRQKTQHGYFPLQNNGRCAFLDCEGLCRIISGVGEDYLCDICREHPRYYGVGKYGIEGGLGLACPEAARIILAIDELPKAVEINREVCYCDEDDYKELGESIRERLYESIFKGSVAELAGLYIAYASAADDAAFEALGGNRTAVSIEKASYLPIDNEEIKRLLCGMLDLLSECESLTDNWNDVLKRSSEIKAEELSQYTVRSLLYYFTHRYVREGISDMSIRGRILFALLSAIVVSAMAKTVNSNTDAAVLFSKNIEYSTENVDLILDRIADIL